MRVPVIVALALIPVTRTGHTPLALDRGLPRRFPDTGLV
ncbi:unannotated protein [freshwater metagenome]|uniref:Unannotated protein n=1 Tax=freshwater metagenome TaxID=449393 RepID=A0A6J7IV03_9ZZZZ